VSVSLAGDQAKITLEALSGAEGTPDRQYVNFLPSSVSVVDPQGLAQRIQLPQVAPGEYQTTLPVPKDGVYTLQATENESDGSVASQAGGFVVPYSPEYRDLSTNTAFLGGLASATGGRSIDSAADAFAHDLPAVGAPRPIWPILLTLLAMVLVADVAVRRVRFTAFEVRSGYAAVRKRLGYLDQPIAPRRQAPARIAAVPLVATPARTRIAGNTQPPQAARSTMSAQLLAAKKRAAKR
jgi:hypothetical protein